MHKPIPVSVPPFLALMILLSTAGRCLPFRPPEAPAPAPRATILFLDDFENTAFTRANWSPADAFAFSQGRDGAGVRVVQNEEGQSRLMSAVVDLTGAGGSVAALSAHLRTEAVASDEDPWTGAALYLKVHASGKPVELHAVRAAEGSRGWWNAGVLFTIPEGAERATLCAGLEGSSGRVYIDNVRLEVVRTPADLPPPRDPALPIDKGHSLGALRGAMVSTAATSADLQELGGEWKANIVRWQLGATLYEQGLSTPGFDAVLEGELSLLDAALPQCEASGLLVLVDLHSLSRGCFDGMEAQDRFVAAWASIARRYLSNPTVWGYDLANEPDGTYGAWGEGIQLWEPLAERAARAIRTIDARRPIVVESLYGSPSGFPHLIPLDFSIPGIVYSAHMYEPHHFTHQTLYGYDLAVFYPGHTEGEFWDKERLKTALQPVRDFQEKYRVPVLIGEFSAIRWAPQGSAYRYLRDAIEVFEEWNWDWCFHAFREWHGWSPEHTENPKDQKPASEPTDRELLLRGWFARNTQYFPGHEKPVAKP